MGGQRIAFRQARDLGILVIGGDKDVIGLVEDVDIPVELDLVIRPVHLQDQVAAIEAAKGIVIIDAEGERIIVIGLVGHGRSGNGEHARVDRQRYVVLLPAFHLQGRIERQGVRFAAWIRRGVERVG